MAVFLAKIPILSAFDGDFLLFLQITKIKNKI